MRTLAHALAWLCAWNVAGAESRTVDNSGSSLRARAWATILFIQEESVRTLETEERVMAHRLDGEPLTMARYVVRADDLRNVLVRGEVYYHHRRGGEIQVETRRVLTNCIEGVLRGINPDRGTGVVRLEQPQLILPWSMPSSIRGLGRVPVLGHIHSRSERLISLSDLRVEKEGDQAVTLTGSHSDNGRVWLHRVEIDPTRGIAVRHEMINPTWDISVADWSIPSWTKVESAWLPSRVESRLFEPAIDQATWKRIRNEMEAAGISAEAMHPGDKNFGRWREVRSAVFPLGCPPARLIGGEWLSSECKHREVNIARDLTWFALPDIELKSVLSSPLECPVGRLEPEP